MLTDRGSPPPKGEGRPLGKDAPLDLITELQPDFFTPTAAARQPADCTILPERSAGPWYKDVGAGREAADKFRPNVGRRQQEAFRGLGDTPITADELAAKIGRPTYITRPRLTELLAMGLVVKAEGRGVSDFGAPATLWRRATSAERDQFTARKAAEAEHTPGAAP